MKNWNNQKQQIPTLEILPEGTKLTGVTAVIPVFFIAFGIMEMLQNIWGDAAPGIPKNLLSNVTDKRDLNDISFFYI